MVALDVLYNTRPHAEFDDDTTLAVVSVTLPPCLRSWGGG